MAAEAGFSITAKNAHGDLCTVRGDSYSEFSGNVSAAFGHDATGILERFNSAFGATQPTPTQAVQNVQQAFPQAQAVSTVGQPLPQPVVVQPAAVAPAPPTVNYPGDCAHGRRVYVDKPARGKQWQRYECAIPWSKDAVGRCAPVNV